MFSNNKLREYLDGDLDEKTVAKIESELLTNDDLQRRLLALDTYAVPVREVMKELPGQSRISVLEKELDDVLPAQRSGLASFAGAAIAACAIFAIGWWSAGFVSKPGSDWRDQVAQYQSLYVADTVRSSALNNPNLKQQLAQVAKSIDLPLDADRLSGLDGLKLARAQLLGINGKPLAQIAFLDSKDRPFALCIVQGISGKATMETNLETRFGLASASWSTGNYGFILIGGDDTQYVEALAKDIRRFW